MDNFLRLAGDAIYGVGRPILAIWLMVLGAGAILFAIRLVMVQPKRAADEAGWDDQQRALLLAVPIALLGAGLCYLGVSLP